MKRFKVGDKVIRTGKDYKDIKKEGIYVVSEVSKNSNKWSCAINLEGHYNKNGEFDYDGNSFQLYEENSMNDNENKIKVGDTVRLKSGIICCGLNHMTQYLIERVRCKSVVLEGKDGAYDESIFIKVKSNQKLIGEILSPLEAANAILHREPLQEFCEYTGKWFDFAYSLKGVTLDMLQNTKFRRKPKTIIINGVEVPAPIDTVTLGYPDKVWGINLSHKRVYNSTGHTKKGLFWTTEEDAQKVLDAMLLPFDKLNKGDK